MAQANQTAQSAASTQQVPAATAVAPSNKARKVALRIITIAAAIFVICLVVGNCKPSPFSLGSGNSSRQEMSLGKWDFLPDGSRSVTLDPGQWSQVLELQFEHSWNLEQLCDCRMILNGNHADSIFLRKGGDLRVSPNTHTIQIQNKGDVRMTFTVTYGAPHYAAPRRPVSQAVPQQRYYGHQQCQHVSRPIVIRRHYSYHW